MDASEEAYRSSRARSFVQTWARFLTQRLVGLIGTMFTLVVITFSIIQFIPGDPARAIAGEDATTSQVEAVRQNLGLDLPLFEQFWAYLVGLLQGDLGISFMFNLPVATIIANRFPFTLVISAIAILAVLVIAVPSGLLVSAGTQNGKRPVLGRTFSAVTGVLDSIPGYVMASFLLALFGVGVGVLELLPPAYSPRSVWPSMILPIAALMIGPASSVARVVRRETDSILSQDYIRTARGWRLPARRIYVKHVLPNILTSTLTLSGLVLSGMLGGALVIETVFAIPGLGTGIIKAILDRDFPMIQGYVLVIGLLAALVNLAVDVILGILDPRTLDGGAND